MQKPMKARPLQQGRQNLADTHEIQTLALGGYKDDPILWVVWCASCPDLKSSVFFATKFVPILDVQGEVDEQGVRDCLGHHEWKGRRRVQAH